MLDLRKTLDDKRVGRVGHQLPLFDALFVCGFGGGEVSELLVVDYGLDLGGLCCDFLGSLCHLGCRRLGTLRRADGLLACSDGGLVEWLDLGRHDLGEVRDGCIYLVVPFVERSDGGLETLLGCLFLLVTAGKEGQREDEG